MFPQGTDIMTPIPDQPQTSAIDLFVDATDTDRGIFRVRQSLPLYGQTEIVLAMAAWLPAYHAPQGSVDLLAGLRIETEQGPCTWWRDPINAYHFRVDTPADASHLTIAFDALTPTDASQGRVLVSDDMLRLQWSAVLLYPADRPVDEITINASTRLPTGWDWISGLHEFAVDADGTIRFSEASVRTLVDSPLLAGRWARRETLSPGIELLIAADRADQLPFSEDMIAPHRKLIAEADALFGNRPFDRYAFLMTLSDQIGSMGLEHRRCSEVGVRSTYFSSWDSSTTERDLLPHEYVHSWVGKYRVPRGNFQPTFDLMTDELMWVYEGLTEYYGHVLAARCGLIGQDLTRDAFALTFAMYDQRPGRTWRPLADTDMDPIFTAREPQPWTSWQRSEDYYSEGLLIWLEADMIIRSQTGGSRSLDDFAHGFFAPEAAHILSTTSAPYSRMDVVAGLRAVLEYDWAEFFAARIDRIAPHAPYRGITLGGYELAWQPFPSDWLAHDQIHYSYFDFRYSVGVQVGLAARVLDVIWDSPAFRAGMVRGMEILGVDGRSYSHAAMQDGIDAAFTAKRPLALTVRRFDRVKEVQIVLERGQSYPILHRAADAATPSYLDRALAPRVTN